MSSLYLPSLIVMLVGVYTTWASAGHAKASKPTPAKIMATANLLRCWRTDSGHEDVFIAYPFAGFLTWQQLFCLASVDWHTGGAFISVAVQLCTALPEI